MASQIIDFAPFDREIAREKTANAVEFVDRMAPALGDKPRALRMFTQQAQLAAAGLALDGKREATRYLVRSARAEALLFVHTLHPSEATTIALDDEHVAVLAGPADPSRANARAWLDAMWCALAVGDVIAERWLATVPTSALSPSGTQFAPHSLPMVDFLRSLAIRDGQHAAALAAAIEHSGAAGGPADETREWTDAVDFPALRAAFSLLSGDDDGFARDLASLLQAHRDFYAKGGFGASTAALLSLPACALRRLAAEKGLSPAVLSPYMAPAVWKAAVSSPIVTCPYCVYPKPRDARCGLCGEPAGKDAPLEFATAHYVGLATKPCSQCRYALPELAVRCPRCRTRQ